MHIILLPGMDGTGLLFEPLLREVNLKYAVTVITYPLDRKTTYPELVNEVLSKLPVTDEYIIVAESYSGPIGYAIACHPPANLRAVVFVATFISKPNRIMWIFSLLPMTQILKWTIPTFLLKHFLIGYNADEYLINLFIKAMKTVSSNVLVSRLQEMANLKLADETIKVPCTYILAEQDRAVSHTRVDEFKRVAPQLEVVTIAGPHGLLQLHPKECLQVIQRYMIQ